MGAGFSSIQCPKITVQMHILRGLTEYRLQGGRGREGLTFFCLFRQTRITRTSSRMTPMPTMSKGMLDASVTINSMVLI